MCGGQFDQLVQGAVIDAVVSPTLDVVGVRASFSTGPRCHLHDQRIVVTEQGENIDIGTVCGELCRASANRRIDVVQAVTQCVGVETAESMQGSESRCANTPFVV